MGRIEIEVGSLRLGVERALGAGIAEFSVRGRDGEWWPLMRPAPAGVSRFNDLACYTLAPWTNRIAGARFEFAGRTYELAPDWRDGTAIHGLVKDKPWRILDRSPVSARLRFDWDRSPSYPFPFSVEVRYEIDGPMLRVESIVRNEGAGPMPAGVGFHPYFMRRLWADEECSVRCGVRGRYPAKGMIPTGPAAPDDVTRQLGAGRVLGLLELDDVFDGFTGARIEWPRSGVAATLEVSPTLGHAVIYSPVKEGRPAPHFCVEPVSMVNDGFNLHAHGWAGTGVAVLEPGKVLRGDWSLRIEGPEHF